MFKEVKCQKVKGNEIVHNALYAWNREVKETFFKNFACAYLFIKAMPFIYKMQEKKALISKDNVGKSTKGIKKNKKTPKKETLTPQEKFNIYCEIIEEYKDLAYELSLDAKNFTFKL